MGRLDGFAGNDESQTLDPDGIKRYWTPPYPNGLFVEEKATVVICRACNTSDLAQGASFYWLTTAHAGSRSSEKPRNHCSSMTKLNKSL